MLHVVVHLYCRCVFVMHMIVYLCCMHVVVYLNCRYTFVLHMIVYLCCMWLCTCIADGFAFALEYFSCKLMCTCICVACDSVFVLQIHVQLCWV